MSDSHNIPPTGRPGNHLDQDKLLAYLEGRLSPAEQHEVEAWLAADGMESDAIEGLSAMPAAERAHSISTLERGLRKKLGTRRRKPRKSQLSLFQLIIACFLILGLAVLAYVIVRYSL